MESSPPSAATLLRAVREAKGWKASRLAGEVGVSETTFSRWENGHQRPSTRHQRRLCQLLGADPSDLGFEEDILEVDRRRFVQQLLRAVGVGAATPLLELGGDESLERLALAIRQPSRVDERTVQHLEAVTQNHRELYHALGPFELLGEITGHLRALMLLLADIKRSTLRRRLATIAGETAGHAAWLSFDIQHHRAVTWYYDIADAVMAETGDPALDAYIHGFHSIVRRSTGAPKDALQLVRAANDMAARSATATTKSWLDGLEAQALADIADAKSCFIALKRSEAAIERSRPEEDPVWMYQFDRARLAVIAGSCYRRLGKTKAAQRTLEEALVFLGPSCSSRRRAEVLLELAHVESKQGDVGRGCELATEALDGYVQSGSAAGVDGVRQFRAALDGHAPRRTLVALDERLAALV